MMECAGELRAVWEYVLARDGNATLPFGQELKKMVGRMEISHHIGGFKGMVSDQCKKDVTGFYDLSVHVEIKNRWM
jgi:hypothetical protein